MSCRALAVQVSFLSPSGHRLMALRIKAIGDRHWTTGYAVRYDVVLENATRYAIQFDAKSCSAVSAVRQRRGQRASIGVGYRLSGLSGSGIRARPPSTGRGAARPPGGASAGGVENGTCGHPSTPNP